MKGVPIPPIPPRRRASLIPLLRSLFPAFDDPDKRSTIEESKGVIEIWWHDLPLAWVDSGRIRVRGIVVRNDAFEPFSGPPQVARAPAWMRRTVRTQMEADGWTRVEAPRSMDGDARLAFELERSYTNELELVMVLTSVIESELLFAWQQSLDNLGIEPPE